MYTGSHLHPNTPTISVVPNRAQEGNEVGLYPFMPRPFAEGAHEVVVLQPSSHSDVKDVQDKTDAHDMDALIVLVARQRLYACCLCLLSAISRLLGSAVGG